MTWLKGGLILKQILRCGPRGLIVALACAATWGCATPVGKYLARRGADLADCVAAEAGVGWPVAPFLLPQSATVGSPTVATAGQASRGTGGRPSPAMGASAPARRGPKPAASGPTWRVLLRPEAYLRVKTTDFAVIGAGFAQPVGYGWRGRYCPSGVAWSRLAGLPGDNNQEETAGNEVYTRRVIHTTHTYDLLPPGPGGRVADRFWIGVGATVLVSVRLDFNFVELADFLTGWFGWDLLNDDEWSPKKP